MVGDNLRERLRGLERRELIGLLVLGALVVGGAGFWYARSLPGRVNVAAIPQGMGLGPRAPDAAATPSPSPAEVVVYVSGWVRHPGVYRFHQGDRVIDAIRRAGGARSGADLASINLAALLTDAEQILVGRRGAEPGGGSSSSVGSGVSGGSSGGSLVNLNTATLDQLEALPGIGEVTAQRIIDYREQHGPYRSVDDLLNVSGIGDKRLADLRPYVTV